MSEESLMPRRDAIWAKHDGLTPSLAAEMLALAGELERELTEARAQRDALAMSYGELIAAVRVNTRRGTFREATVEQIDEWLKPWVDKLAVKGEAK
jgi:hypothetical protein